MATWNTTEMKRETKTATLRIWADGARWSAEVIDKSTGNTPSRSIREFARPGDAMDWADDRWRELFP